MSFLKKNKFLSTIFIFLFVITSISLLDMISIEPKYLNQPTITFKINNVRNPQIKKVVRFLDSIYGKIYFYPYWNQRFIGSVSYGLYVDNFPNYSNLSIFYILGLLMNYPYKMLIPKYVFI